MSKKYFDMDSKNSYPIILTDLANGFPAITPVFGATLAEACAVCLSDRKHPQGINLIVERDLQAKFKLYWQPVTSQMRMILNFRFKIKRDCKCQGFGQEMKNV